MVNSDNTLNRALYLTLTIDFIISGLKTDFFYLGIIGGNIGIEEIFYCGNEMVKSLYLRMLWTTSTRPQHQSSRSNVFPIPKCLETFPKINSKEFFSRASLEPCSTASNHVQPQTTVEPHWIAYNRE